MRPGTKSFRAGIVFLPTTASKRMSMAKTHWEIDPAHSEIHFKVKHMMITTVSGSFGRFKGGAETEDDNFENASIHFSAETASVDTNAPDRDKHLRSADFFDSEHFPELSFQSTGMKKKSDDEYELQGTLSIRGQSQPVTLKAEFGGIGKDPYGTTKAGFSLSGTIDRSKFGLKWNAALETGGVLVSNDVKIAAEVQLIRS
jgi:polyisoprenoid-binding protein YceI